MVISLTALTSCASRVEQRAEQVFREHNDVSAELMLVWAEVDEADRLEELEAAESRMVEACRTLVDAAATHRDGGRPDNGTEILASLEACECETDRVRRLMASEAELPDC